MKRALDLFCSAGGATRGLQMAGYHVTGVDINPQPRYIGDAFYQADALTFPLEGYDLIWASPPCQSYSVTKSLHNNTHPDLVAPIRERLQAAGVPYIIENVIGAPLIDSLMLCGLSFGLRVLRHRIFESNCFMLAPAHHTHRGLRTGTHRDSNQPRWTPEQLESDPSLVITVAGNIFKRDTARIAMGIDWMNRHELAQAIPPAYSYFLAQQIHHNE